MKLQNYRCTTTKGSSSAARPTARIRRPGSLGKTGRAAVSVRIDSAQAMNGVGRASALSVRLEQFAHRNTVIAAEAVVALSDGAPWIQTVCEEILLGGKTTFILHLYHALEYASAAVQAVTSGGSGFVKAPANTSSGTGSNCRGAVG